jgi:glucokinase-like ROK family protein
MLTMLQEAAGEGEPAGRLLGVALGVPGLVDERTGELLFAPNLGWQQVSLLAPLRAVFDAPVFVGNEAKLAALGEYWFGAAQGYSEVLYINLGVGVGGAVVRGGQLYTGYSGLASEFGHMTVDPEGLPCNCGSRGCWETLVSQPAVFREIRCAIDVGQHTVILDMVDGDLDRLTIPIVVKAAEAGDNIALDVLNRVGHYLGIGIASLINALNPQLIVLGGTVSLAGEFLLPVIEDELRQRAMRWSREATEIVQAQYGVDACLMGGTATIYQAVLMQPNQMI